MNIPIIGSEETQCSPACNRLLDRDLFLKLAGLSIEL
jgi:hypothetical protein